MADAIDREQLRSRLVRMTYRVRQHRNGPYKCGYMDAARDAIRAAEDCDQLETPAVVRCKNCRHATERCSTMPYCTIHNRRRMPEDFCNFGETDYE